MRTAVRFHDDTLHEMARWAARRYKLGKVDILFCEYLPGAGFTHSSGRADFQRGRGFIELNEHRTVSTLVQVLAHELAHCIAIKRYGYRGHGRKFVRVANEMISGWNSFAKGGAA
jgi:SprT-like family